MLLWNLPEYGLEDGEILPVYVKSTISKVYVIGLPGRDEKIEIPLWQITAPASKRKAQTFRAKYQDYQNQYARTLLDGLPIRFQTVNTARQVYRLRKDEVVKVLYKGEGQPVMAGANPLDGDWLRVLTADGTEGWCFSYNLSLYDSQSQDARNTGQPQEPETSTAALAPVFEKIWRPESWQTMITNNTIDLSQMRTNYEFTIDSVTKTGRLQLAGTDVRFAFTGISQGPGNSSVLDNSPITLNLRNENLLSVSCLNDRGIPVSYNFVPLEEALIKDIIAREQERRAGLYDTLLTLGPDFVSENYGALRFAGGNNVVWTGNQQLVPYVISMGSGSRGTVEFKYFLSDGLRLQFDGVITITLTGSNKENNFFYILRDNGIQLEDAGGVSPQNSVFAGRSVSPTVMFFVKQ
jgi:hypothetical protein